MGKIERILVRPDDAQSSGSPSSTPNDDLPAGSSNPEPPTNNSSSKNTAITAGVLGTLLLAATIALGLMALQNRRLKKSLADEQARAAAQELRSPGDSNMGYYKYYHQGQIPQEVADPHYSPPVWVPSELPTAERRGQLEG